MDLEKNVLQKIAKGDIRMRPRWFFHTRDISGFIIAIMLMMTSSLLCGITIALAFHWMREISWVNFPYSLIVLSIILAFLAYRILVRSFSFYKMRLSFWIFLLFGITFSFGYVLFANGNAEKVERRLQNFSLYQYLVPAALVEYENAEITE